MDRVIEIINYVMKQVIFQEGDSCTERNLVESLVQLGYNPDEIEFAFKLIYSMPQNIKTDSELLVEFAEVRSGYRIFSPAEAKKLSISFQGEIIRLMNESLLTLGEMEKVLAEALKLDGGEVGVKELELILHKVIDDEERLLMILPHSFTTDLLFLLN